jgi:hypothetical protein
VSVGKKFLICPILPPMSDLTPFYGISSVSATSGVLNLGGSCRRKTNDDNFSPFWVIVYSFVFINLVTQPILVCLRKKCKNILLYTVPSPCVISRDDSLKSDDYRNLIHSTANRTEYIYPRIVDPHSFHPDPDTAILAEYWSGSRALI